MTGRTRSTASGLPAPPSMAATARMNAVLKNVHQ
jgi:hypothetical protein